MEVITFPYRLNLLSTYLPTPNGHILILDHHKIERLDKKGNLTDTLPIPTGYHLIFVHQDIAFFSDQDDETQSHGYNLVTRQIFHLCHPKGKIVPKGIIGSLLIIASSDKLHYYLSEEGVIVDKLKFNARVEVCLFHQEDGSYVVFLHHLSAKAELYRLDLETKQFIFLDLYRFEPGHRIDLIHPIGNIIIITVQTPEQEIKCCFQIKNNVFFRREIPSILVNLKLYPFLNESLLFFDNFKLCEYRLEKNKFHQIALLSSLEHLPNMIETSSDGSYLLFFVRSHFYLVRYRRQRNSIGF